ncbi:MAG: LysM peptidoglycan-binding domain-containing protein [Myxococcota bacterium]|nr:LysM peptidoglycan-binding domain-containing protein [Myxococcota bacterium]
MFLFVCQPSEARRVRKIHVVQAGESVARIADDYNVSQRDLRELNQLRQGQPLKIGQKLRIPNVLRVAGKKYEVCSGDSLALIAKRFRTDPQTIATANKLDPNNPLSIGQTLVIPDKRAMGGKTIALNGERPAPISFVRVFTGERARLRLYNNAGTILKGSVRRLSFLARDKRGRRRVKRLHDRLIEMLQRVAFKFPDTPIQIISGYRPQSDGNESQHAFGRAIDFRMPGVPTASLFRCCKQLPRSGCGYYPQSNFVHMDAREKKFSWIGEKSSRPATAQR